jgi:hypothetical protein
LNVSLKKLQYFKIQGINKLILNYTIQNSTFVAALHCAIEVIFMVTLDIAMLLLGNLTDIKYVQRGEGVLKLLYSSKPNICLEFRNLPLLMIISLARQHIKM